MWHQHYHPLGNWVISTLLAALPILVLLGSLAFFRVKAHWAALMGLATALLVAVGVFHMPLAKAGATAVYGAAYGLFPIGWIIFNVILLYNLTNEKGLFPILQHSLTAVTNDRRLQLLLIAFSFGAFFEGAAGFGTPVAVTAAILIGLGFGPLAASGLSLIANTAPVAYGALGTPITALAGVTGIDAFTLGAQVGRILPFFSVLIPFWLILAFSGWKGLKEVWPATLVAGVSFAVPQYLMSHFHGPTLVDVVASVVSIVALIGFLFIWQPRRIWTSATLKGHEPEAVTDPETGETKGDDIAAVTGCGDRKHATGEIVKAWTPWVILSVVVFLWGYPGFKSWLNSIASIAIPVPDVDKLIARMPPVVAKPTPEDAVFVFNWLSFTGTGILASTLISSLVMRVSLGEFVRCAWATLVRVRYSLLTVAAMLSLGYVTRYAGLDGTMGLTFAKTGVLYPIFGTVLGWLGVALTGSDTSSNAMFGSLQTISAKVVGVSPTLMAAANSCGGVMGKMIDAQSIVVASTATKWYGHEGEILRYVFFHSIALAFLVGVMVFLQAYVPPFTRLAVP
jgi:lactate permease